MKNVVIAVVLLALGAAGAVVYIKTTQSARPTDSHEGRSHEALQAAAGPLCAKHGIADSICAFCHPELVEKLGVCHSHDVPEAFCTRCTPALIPAFKIENDWCDEHGLPESQCTICNPSLSQAAPAHSEQPSIVLISSSEQPRARRAPSVTCTNEQKTVHFANVDVAQRAGLEIARAKRQPVTQSIQCNAELAFNGDRLTHLSSRAAGTIHATNKSLGDRVEAGDVLALIDSSEIGVTKAEFLQAQSQVKLRQTNHQRQVTLNKTGDTPLRELLDAEAALTDANIALARAVQRLRNLGFSDAQIDETAESGDAQSLLAVAAPFAGTVIERDAVLGEVVDTEHVLFSIADTSSMWAMLDVYESDVRAIAVGQNVMIELAGMEGDPVAGRITWIGAQIDPKTRTLKARAEIDNPDGLLKANVTGRATISVHDREDMLVVPAQAVQWEGCCNIVFVQRSETDFQPRKVRLGYRTGDWIVVEDGLTSDEPIVTNGSFLLKTEVLKGSIGAGCCEAHHPGK